MTSNINSTGVNVTWPDLLKKGLEYGILGALVVFFAFTQHQQTQQLREDLDNVHMFIRETHIEVIRLNTEALKMVRYHIEDNM